MEVSKSITEINLSMYLFFTWISGHSHVMYGLMEGRKGWARVGVIPKADTLWEVVWTLVYISAKFG